MGDVANVVSGPAKLFVAPVGTAIPNLTGNVSAFAAFTDVGFTDKGVEFDYSATDKDIEVDELTSPVDILIDKEKVEINVVLAETTLENLYFCISGGTLASATELTVGGKVRPSEFVLGIHGPGPNGGTRQIIVYRAMPQGNPKVHWQRNDKTMFAAKFRGLADSTRADGANICGIEDFGT
jgi:hypothetical protein